MNNFFAASYFTPDYLGGIEKESSMLSSQSPNNKYFASQYFASQYFEDKLYDGSNVIDSAIQIPSQFFMGKYFTSNYFNRKFYDSNLTDISIVNSANKFLTNGYFSSQYFTSIGVENSNIVYSPSGLPGTRFRILRGFIYY